MHDSHRGAQTQDSSALSRAARNLPGAVVGVEALDDVAVLAVLRASGQVDLVVHHGSTKNAVPRLHRKFLRRLIKLNVSADLIGQSDGGYCVRTFKARWPRIGDGCQLKNRRAYFWLAWVRELKRHVPNSNLQNGETVGAILQNGVHPPQSNGEIYCWMNTRIWLRSESTKDVYKIPQCEGIVTWSVLILCLYGQILFFAPAELEKIKIHDLLERETWWQNTTKYKELVLPDAASRSIQSVWHSRPDLWSNVMANVVLLITSVVDYCSDYNNDKKHTLLY